MAMLLWKGKGEAADCAAAVCSRGDKAGEAPWFGNESHFMQMS